MADRGFLIEEDLASRNASFTKGKTQLSQKQVESSRQLARVRIHVVRAIERIKRFKLLSTSMSLNLVPRANSILTICSAICNLQPIVWSLHILTRKKWYKSNFGIKRSSTSTRITYPKSAKIRFGEINL